MLCYVLGCRDRRSVLTARHSRFGLVESCVAHDPARHGYGRLIVEAPQAVQAPATSVGRPPLAGGAKVPRVPVPRIQPPTATAKRF